MGHDDVVRKLNERGICVCVHTSIDSQTMTNEDKQRRENRFVKFFYRLTKKGRKSDLNTKVWNARACLENGERLLKGVRVETKHCMVYSLSNIELTR